MPENIENQGFQPDQTELNQNEQKARLIAQEGDFDMIEKQLKEENLFEGEIDRVKKKFENDIDLTDFPTVSKSVWELLTIEDLYDEETVQHCVETYKLAKEKIQKVLSGNVVLSLLIKSEGVEIERFYFACLTHDIGKVEVPGFIIRNKTTKKEWQEILEEIIDKKEFTPEMLEVLDINKNTSPTKQEVLKKISEKDLHAEELVPVGKALTDEEIGELENKWHIFSNQSLMSIINKHADISKIILEKKGFPKAASIAAQHHHRKDEDLYPVSVDSLQVSSDMADILHLADVEQALASSRSYKKQFTPLEVVKILVDHASRDQIGKEVAYLWIKDEREKMEKRGDFKELDFKQSGSLEKIDNFISQFEIGDHKDDLENWIAKHKAKLENAA
ncbi:hypothetical protein HOD96_01265 [Candidatus Falkowbacteria bacterium]|jgi:HD-GYP domain-containing protein (c-di-GMP phosphodiesterase class II)|nr:hypothetical protein [Candidatus Falkowbacteria bacterium]MBT4433035.1 hypothetical protein [Candidatus Falkowbacteria bacterium]